MGYIELWGNPIAEYETEKRISMLKNGEIIDEKQYENKLLAEEKDYYEEEQERLSELLSSKI